MAVKQVVPGLWAVPLGSVNAFLLDSGEGLTLVDTGFVGSGPKILRALREIGRGPGDLRRILVTHCHGDHAGGLAEMKRLTSATATMHPEDAAMVRAGRSARPLSPSPGLVNGLLGRLILRIAPAGIEAATVEHEVGDGETLPGNLRVIHVPGHCAGQVAFLWPEHGGVLLAADAAVNLFGLGLSPVYEDLAEGRRSLAKLAALEFEVACFGHGKAITSGASARFRAEWPATPGSPAPVP